MVVMSQSMCELMEERQNVPLVSSELYVAIPTIAVSSSQITDSRTCHDSWAPFPSQPRPDPSSESTELSHRSRMRLGSRSKEPCFESIQSSSIYGCSHQSIICVMSIPAFTQRPLAAIRFWYSGLQSRQANARIGSVWMSSSCNLQLRNSFSVMHAG